MSQVELSAKVRPETGKEAAGRLRRQNAIPAVLYGGDSQASMPLAVDAAQMTQFLKKEGKNVLISLKLEGKKKQADQTVMVRDIQAHPIKHNIIHVDFLRISMDKPIELTVPIRLTGESVGVKQQGGILEQIARELNIQCLPTKIPEFIQVDISGLALGKSIHASDIQPPEGVTVLAAPEQIIASVVEKIAEEKMAPPAAEAPAEAAAEAPKAEEETK